MEKRDAGQTMQLICCARNDSEKGGDKNRLTKVEHMY
jgi:hypothetical protein